MSALGQDIRRRTPGSAAGGVRAAGRARRAEQGALTAMARSLSLQARAAEGERGAQAARRAQAAGAPGSGVELGQSAHVAGSQSGSGARASGEARSRPGCAPAPTALLRRRPLAARRA